jgi:hypothetical protein
LAEGLRPRPGGLLGGALPATLVDRIDARPDRLAMLPSELAGFGESDIFGTAEAHGLLAPMALPAQHPACGGWALHLEIEAAAMAIAQLGRPSGRAHPRDPLLAQLPFDRRHLGLFRPTGMTTGLATVFYRFISERNRRFGRGLAEIDEEN